MKHDHWEFLDYPYRVLPAEILCIQRIRQDFGHDPVEIRHPLIQDNPLASIPAKVSSVRDSFFTEIETVLAENYDDKFPPPPVQKAAPKVVGGVAKTLITIQYAPLEDEQDEEEVECEWPDEWPQQKTLSLVLKLLGCSAAEAEIDGLIEDEPVRDWTVAFEDRLESAEPDGLVVFDWKETDRVHVVSRLAEAARSIGLHLSVEDKQDRPVVTYKKKEFVWHGRSRKHDALVAGLNAVIAGRGEFMGVATLDGKSADAYGYYIFSPGLLNKARKKLGPDFSQVFRKIGKKKGFK